MGFNMKLMKISALAGAAMLVSSPAMSMAILIDDFDAFQEVVDVPVLPQVSTSTLVDGSIFGGSRTLTVATDPSSISGSVLRSTGTPSGFNPPSALTFSNGALQRGVATVEYNGNGAGLGDLTNGGLLDRFFFEVLFADLAGTELQTTVVDGDGDSDTFIETFDAGFDPFTRFSSFDAAVDFDDVASLSFVFDTVDVASFDGALGSISVVPLPASVLFLIGGLGGLAGVSTVANRRRRKA